MTVHGLDIDARTRTHTHELQKHTAELMADAHTEHSKCWSTSTKNEGNMKLQTAILIELTLELSRPTDRMFRQHLAAKAASRGPG